MSDLDEEVKAIIELKYYSNLNAYWKQKEYTNSEIDNYIKIILNLIEKQEKVIQGLNKQADELVDDYEKQLQEKNEYIFRLESERDRWE